MTTLLTEAYLSIFCYAAEATAPCIGYGGLRLFERLTQEEWAACARSRRSVADKREGAGANFPRREAPMRVSTTASRIPVFQRALLHPLCQRSKFSEINACLACCFARSSQGPNVDCYPASTTAPVSCSNSIVRGVWRRTFERTRLLLNCPRLNQCASLGSWAPLARY